MRQWAAQGEVANLLGRLLSAGFDGFLTADHGNVEATSIGRPGEAALAVSRGERARAYADTALRDRVKRQFLEAIEWSPVGLPAGYLPLLAPGRSAGTSQQGGRHFGAGLEATLPAGEQPYLLPHIMMFPYYHRHIMVRTTVDLEEPILRELKAMGQRQGRPLGKLISELVAEALAVRRVARQSAPPPRLQWISKPMHAKVDWADTDALAALLEQDDQERLLAKPSRPDRTSSRETAAADR